MSSLDRNLVLLTERLKLREITAGDAGWIVAWRSDPEAYKYFLNPHPITLRNHRNWYTNSYENTADRIDLFAEDRFSGDAVGVFGIVRKSLNEAEVNYLVDDEHQGKGFASEGVKALMKWATEFWESDVFIAEVYKDNFASIRMIKRIGFVKDAMNGEFITFKKDMKC